jgi:hypothetical protein
MGGRGMSSRAYPRSRRGREYPRRSCELRSARMDSGRARRALAVTGPGLPPPTRSTCFHFFAIPALDASASRGECHSPVHSSAARR